MKETVGLHCPFTKDNLGAGVETSVHVTLPLRADVALQHAKLSVTLKTPVDYESQKVTHQLHLCGVDKMIFVSRFATGNSSNQ